MGRVPDDMTQTSMTQPMQAGAGEGAT